MPDINIVAQVSDWLINKLCVIYKVPSVKIDINKNLSEYGLDSLNAIAITGELEELFELELPNTLFWNYPTITKVAEFISSQYNL
jgi:acyl carrier protein